MDSVIKVTGLKKYFGSVKAVDGISLTVEKGELFGFLGVNGAGKSTTINMLCTIFPPTEGEIEVCGFRVGKEDEEIRKRIGVVYQNNCLDDRLTVWENLMVRGSLYENNGGKLKQRITQICDILDLGEVADRRFARLSGGQKRRCEIARALVNTPQIMFLDEPTTGLDPATRKNVWECLERLQKEEGMTIFLTTHYMEEAAKASHIAIIDAGCIKDYGTPFALKERYAKDCLRLIPKAGSEEKLKEFLVSDNLAFQKREADFAVTVPDSMAALPILKKSEEWIEGFEMLQGTMDDVFLNVTGKELDA